MSIEDLKRNVEQERKILRDINFVEQYLSSSSSSEKIFYSSALNSLLMQIKILNNNIPILLKDISPFRKLSEEQEKERSKEKEIVRLSYVSPSSKETRFIVLNRKDKGDYLKELKVSEEGLSSLKKKTVEEKEILSRKPSKIARISNLYFSGISEKLSKKFSGLNESMKKANLSVMLGTYISIALFVSLLIFAFSLVGFGVLALLKFAFLKWLWVPFALGILSLIGFYFYPSVESSSLEKRINYELPFATIHMSAIAGAEISPMKIFKIIALSKEYPTIGKEFKKIINQIDIYGYDIVNALKNTAKQTSNPRLAELFEGIATNIVSGGDLKNYLDKKSANFLIDYRLERQNYSALAATFMDIYISILITAPLILMMLFIVMNVTRFDIGLPLDVILFLSIGFIILVNIIFMIVLEIKQPKT